MCRARPIPFFCVTIMEEQKIQVGGQAVIEGVMMRSHDSYSIAVRRQDGTIFVRKKPFTSFVKRYKLLSLPILRGAFVLIESLVLGVKALTFSGDVAMQDEQSKEAKNGKEIPSLPPKRSFWSNVWLGATVLFSLVLGLGIFSIFHYS